MYVISIKYLLRETRKHNTKEKHCFKEKNKYEEPNMALGYHEYE